MRSVKYVILPPINRRSSGQAILDASIIGRVPCFSWRYNERIYSKLIQPSFCVYESISELVYKLNLLEKDEDLYEHLKQTIGSLVPYVDIRNSPSACQLMERVELIHGDRTSDCSFS